MFWKFCYLGGVIVRGVFVLGGNCPGGNCPGVIVRGVIVRGVIVLEPFFPTITSKYIYQLSEKTLILSVFDFLGLRDPHFQEIRFFCAFVRTMGSSLY